MIFNTNIDDIKKEMDILKDKMVLAKNTTEYELCLSNLYQLNDLYRGITNSNNINYKKSKNYIYKYNNAYNFHIKNNIRFLENFIKYKEYISTISEELSDTIENNLKYSDLYDNTTIKEKEVLEIIYEYLNNYHPDEIDYFNHLLDKKRIFNLNNILNDYDGECILGQCITSYDNDPLIAIKNNKYDISYIGILIHEFGHAVETRKMLENYSINQVQKYDKASFYTEVNSLKYQKEFIDFCIDEKIHRIQALYALEMYYSSILDHADNTYSFCAIKDELLSNYKYLLYEDEFINKNLIVPYEKDDEIIEYSDMDLSDSVRYFIGGLLGIYFSILVKEDKEEAKKLYSLFNSIKLNEFSPEVLDMLKINNMDKYIIKDMNKIKTKKDI